MSSTAPSKEWFFLAAWRLVFLAHIHSVRRSLLFFTRVAHAFAPSWSGIESGPQAAKQPEEEESGECVLSYVYIKAQSRPGFYILMQLFRDFSLFTLSRSPFLRVFSCPPPRSLGSALDYRPGRRLAAMHAASRELPRPRPMPMSPWPEGACDWTNEERTMKRLNFFFLRESPIVTPIYYDAQYSHQTWAYLQLQTTKGQRIILEANRFRPLLPPE
jgi:hypothetical protein